MTDFNREANRIRKEFKNENKWVPEDDDTKISDHNLRQRQRKISKIKKDIDALSAGASEGAEKSEAERLNEEYNDAFGRLVVDKL